MRAITFARESGIPFLGVCLGMQAAVIEYCRAFLNKPLANSKEFSPEISDNDSGKYRCITLTLTLTLSHCLT